MNHDIFISYSSKQKSIADGVCHYLEENGFKCWMAPRDIPVGSEYGDLIEEAIKTSKVVILVFSEAASISKWVKGEINVAFTEDKPILPFRIDETEIKGGFRVMLNQMHWIDAFPHYADRLPDLLSSICGFLGRKLQKVSVDVEQLESERKAKEAAERERKAEEDRRKVEQERIERERIENEKREAEIIRQKSIRCPEGAINGVFSVSPFKKVYFSKGNLQYHASTGIWRFAEKQYDIVGGANGNISPTNVGWIDLFGWGTGNNPIESSNDYEDYKEFVDWGCHKIENGGNRENMWYSLNRDEWEYVLNKRQTSSGLRFAKAEINGQEGLIILPDDWNHGIYHINNTNNNKNVSFRSNVLNTYEWTKIESAGAVFLPCAGKRWTSSVDIGVGCYWSASKSGICDAVYLYFEFDYGPHMAYETFNYGLSVRLVHPV